MKFNNGIVVAALICLGVLVGSSYAEAATPGGIMSYRFEKQEEGVLKPIPSVVETRPFNVEGKSKRAISKTSVDTIRVAGGEMNTFVIESLDSPHVKKFKLKLEDGSKIVERKGYFFIEK